MTRILFILLLVLATTAAAGQWIYVDDNKDTVMAVEAQNPLNFFVDRSNIYMEVDTMVDSTRGVVIDTSYHEYEVWRLRKDQAEAIRKILRAAKGFQVELGQ